MQRSWDIIANVKQLQLFRNLQEFKIKVCKGYVFGVPQVTDKSLI